MTPAYRRLVVGTDGSPTAARAVAAAGALGRTLGVPVVVAVVFERPHPSDLGPPSVRAAESPGEQWQGAAYRGAAETARDAAAALSGQGAPDVDTAVVEGHPAAELIDLAAAEPETLLVVGSQGMDASTRFLLGGVPHRVSHHARSDVLIVRTGEPREPAVPRTLLVGTDGSPTARLAVQRAVALAAGLGARLRIMSAGSDELAKAAVDAAGEIADAAGVAWTAEVVGGRPAEQLIDAGGDVDLLVVGNRGMTGAQRFLLGSVPNRVSHHADSDVLIVATT